MASSFLRPGSSPRRSSVYPSILSMTREMENTHETGAMQPSAIEDQLGDLKRLLEGNARCSAGSEPALGVEQPDRRAELAESVATLRQVIGDFTALKSDLQGRGQNTAMSDSSEASISIYANVEQKDLIKILKESHEDRIRQITTFQQDMKASAHRSHVEILEALSRRN